MYRTIGLLILAAGAALAAPLDAQDVLLTEVMAVNDGVLLDEDGESSDWFEVGNVGATSVNLGDWAVSDDAFELFKWTFPSLTLAPGEFLVVFASEKDRRSAGSELHTNFRLDGDGEFLALVDPSGDIVSSFFPTYGAQYSGISFGLAQGGNSSSVINAGDLCSVLVPGSSSLGLTWTQVGFNDASWISGTTGVGYDMGSDYGASIGTDIETAMRGINASAYVRLPFDVANPSLVDAMALRLKYDDGFVAYLNGQELARRNAPSTPQWNSNATAEHGEAVLGSMSQGFDGGGTGYAVGANGENVVLPQVVSGGPTGSYLELMPDNLGDLSNTVAFARTFGVANIVVAEFDYRMPTEASHTGCCGERADGFGFALLDTVEYGTSGPVPAVGGVVWERPVYPDAFAVGFDIFNGSGTENTVTLNWNGAEQAAQLVSAFQLNNGTFNRVRVEIEHEGGDALVTVRITPNVHGAAGATTTVFNRFRIRNMPPFESRPAFGGRTGGAFTSVHLDNVAVEYTAGFPEIQFETIDVSSRIGALRSGQNVLALQGLNVSASDDDFLLVPELELTSFDAVDPNVTNYFDVPSPGLANPVGYPGVAEEPRFSHAAGAYSTNFNLALTVDSGAATIRYTLDGSDPTESSTAYSGPIAMSTTRLVRARTFEPGLLPSRILEQPYVKLLSNVANFTSNLPIVIVDTLGAGVGSNSQTFVTSVFIDNPDGDAHIQDTADFAGVGGLKIRGSSSQGFPKKQFAFETWDDLRDDADFPILGFPEESDYILYAPYSDKSLMRNWLTYKWSNDIGQWAVRERFVEVFLNTGGGSLSSADHAGIYVFMEKIKRGPDRVDIARLSPGDNSGEELTGGYILKHDRLDPGDVGFATSRGYRLAYVEPKEVEITSAQANYIRNYINSFEAALYSVNFRSPVNGYRRYIDVPSFIDAHIMVEMSKNIDGYRLSFFMYKDKNDTLKMGPVWDYNLSLGNADYLEGWQPQGWYWPLISDGQYIWYRRLFEDPDFQQEYIDRWHELRQDQFLTSRLHADVDAANAIMGAAVARNFATWPVLGSYVWPNWYIASTHAEELTWMKGWIRDRMDWIDSNWLTAPVLSQNGGGLPPGGIDLTMAAPAGTIYYTFDGSDPRASGGAIAPGAQSYGSSTQTTLVSPSVSSTLRVLVPTSAVSSTWRNRTFNDSSWPQYTSGIGVGYENGSGYEGFIDVDVGPAMAGVASSALIRIPFVLADASQYSFLSLRMMYDDGFVAYLNGSEIASANDPATLEWNSEATALHDDAQAVVFQTFAVPAGAADLLVDGTNVLAIHGLNDNPGSSDFLIVPELTASSSADGDPIYIGGATQVRARARVGSQWSALTDAVFVPDVPLALRITEIMYHPPAPVLGDEYDDNDFEFIELLNIGASPISLLGVKFVDGIEFDFTTSGVSTLPPGAYVVVVRDRAAFELLYDTTGMLIAGEYEGSLENLGERIALEDGRGELIHDFTFSDTWYPQTDGGGRSLHIIDPFEPAGTWSFAASWAPSAAVDGSPGAGEDDPPPSGGWQRPGDANQDAVLDISDSIALLRQLFLDASRPLPCDGGEIDEGGNLVLLDTNQDFAVDLTDALYVLNFLFLQGPAPRAGTHCQRIDGCPTVCLP